MRTAPRLLLFFIYIEYSVACRNDKNHLSSSIVPWRAHSLNLSSTLLGCTLTLPLSVLATPKKNRLSTLAFFCSLFMLPLLLLLFRFTFSFSVRSLRQ